MVNDNIVNCKHVWREISNYLEDDVDASFRSRMDEHFQTCSACRSLLEGTRNVIQLYSDERMIEVPSGFGSRLQHRLAQSRPSPGRSWSPYYKVSVSTAPSTVMVASAPSSDTALMIEVCDP